MTAGALRPAQRSELRRFRFLRVQSRMWTNSDTEDEFQTLGTTGETQEECGALLKSPSERQILHAPLQPLFLTPSDFLVVD